MASQTIKHSPGGGKTRSALGSSDPRIGVGGMTKGTTLHGFSSNPFKDGGAMEQRFADSDNKGQGGPRLGNAPNPERVISETDDSQMARQGGGD